MFIRSTYKKGNAYRCCRCRELGKQRVITIVNDVVVGKKNPEDDHHADCEPVNEFTELAKPRTDTISTLTLCYSFGIRGTIDV